MSWYYGTYSCGHNGRTNIVGPEKDRKWKKDREFEKLCPECRNAAWEQKKTKENEQAAAEAEMLGLVQLQGTEKQVLWANTIRSAMLKEAHEYKEELKKRCIRSNGKTKEKLEDMLVMYDDISENIFSNTDARWYIEKRNYLYKLTFCEHFEQIKNK